MTRLAVLGILVLLTFYTAIAVKRLQRTDVPPQASEAARADMLADHLTSEALTLRAALTGAAGLAAHLPDAPIDAAETGLRAAGASATTVAVLRESEVRAAAGDPATDSGLQAAAKAAEASGKVFWIGAPGAGVDVFAVVTVPGEGGRVSAVAKTALSRLVAAQPGEALAIASSEGRLVAGSGPGLAGATVKQAFGVDYLANGVGKLPDGSAVGVAQRPIVGGALTAISAQKDLSAAQRLEAERFNLVSLLAPLLIGLALLALLILQSRNAGRAQAAQAEIEHRFRMAVEAARCGIWEWDLDADQVYMSEVTGVIFGWGGAGVVSGSEIIERIAPDHQERFRQALAAAETFGAFDVSFRVPGREGKSAWIDARGQSIAREPGDKNSASRIVGVALDVTEERIAQARAQSAENRLRDAIESVSGAFVLWDRSGRLIMCNQSYRDYFGLEARILKPGAPRESVNRFVRLAIKQEFAVPDAGPGVREAELNDGRWIQVSERRTSDGGLVMTAADITAIKVQDEARRQNEIALEKAVVNLEQSQAQLADTIQKYEQEKLRAEAANKSKSEFLANMSHELRTPLNAINGFSEIMVGEMFGPMGDARYKEYAQDILSSGQHLLALINDILDMSKIEAGKMNLKFDPMQFEDVAEDAIRLMRNRAEHAGLELIADIPALPDVDADYRAVKQVLLNLLSNALKFTPRGGRITVHAELQIGGLGERIKVSVQDTGIGIAKEDLSRLAKPFEQIESQHSKTQQGTGLGLALTKSLVEMHGGVLELASEPGVGTAVSFALPLRQTQKLANSFAA
ncbi:cell cycle histidine kinase PleC [soil metagenome]